MKMFEEWLWSDKKSERKQKERLTHIEEVQEEENISKEEIQNVLDIYFKHKKKAKFYLNVFHSHKKEIYFDKFIRSYHNTIEQLYRLWKIKDEINVENFNFDEEFKEDSNQYDGTQLTGDNLSSLMMDVTFWLNIMDPRSEQKNVYYYEEIVKNVRGGLYTSFKYKNRIKEEKKKEEHKGVDPFGEEEWKDEN